jgi:DNA-binding transcriptional LysR family regulator
MDISRVDLNLLVVFDALLRTRSVSRAALELGISQPATSFALNRLRKLFEDPLFVRASHGVHPTARAESLESPLRSVLEQIRSGLLQPPSFDPATARRIVTFNMVDIGELVFLPRIVRHLLREAPGIDVRTVSLPVDELHGALASGRVDVAVGYYPGLVAADLFQQQLFRHTFVCIVRRDHPGIGTQITREQFLAARHAVVHPEGQSAELFESLLNDKSLSRRVVLRTKHYLAIPKILSESDLVFTVPYAIGAGIAEMGNVRMMPTPFTTKSVAVRQHWHARFNNDPANRWIRGVIAELFLEERRRAQRGGRAPKPRS